MDPLTRLASGVYRFRWQVLIGCVLVVGLAGVLLAPQASSVMKGGGFVVTGSDSIRTDDVLGTQFHASSLKNAIVVFRSSTMTVDDAAYRAQVLSAADSMAKVAGVESVVTYFSSGDPTMVSSDRHVTTAVVALRGDEGQAEKTAPRLRDAIRNVNLEHWVTGHPAANSDIHVSSEDDLRRSEMFTLPIILVLLLLVFRTLVAAAIPLILGIGTIVLATAALAIIGGRIDTSDFALNTGSMLGLGFAIDYSLIVTSRYRQELDAGSETRRALEVAMATAGRSITYSGITVMLAMLALSLVVLPLMIVRSIGFAVMLVALISVVLANTLLPAILGAAGRRIESLRVIPRAKVRNESAGGFWYRLSQAVMKRPWVWLGASIVILIVLASPIRDLKLTSFSPPPERESSVGLSVLKAAFGPTSASPVVLVLKAPASNGVWNPAFLEGLRSLAETAAADPRVDRVAYLGSLTPSLTRDQFIQLQAQSFAGGPLSRKFVNLDGANDTAQITIILKQDPFSNQSEDFVYYLRQAIIPGLHTSAFAATVGGETATFLDFRDALYGRFPTIVAAVTAMIFLIMLLFFRSIFLPVKAILLNVASILATYGVLVVIFQNGFASGLIGFTSTGAITVITPALLYVILFSLSTDYEVFMLSRVKEQYLASGDNQQAVAVGLQQTAGVITAAALILIGTFSSFATGEQLTIKEIGLGLGIGVLLDATVVRVIMVPATMRLAGRANWWLPAWLNRIVPEVSEGGTEKPPAAPVPAAPAAPAR
jgi:putative drug exporter of the RND superfamily